MCAYKLNDACYENFFAHTVAVMRLHLSKKNNPLLIFTFLKWVAINGTAWWTALSQWCEVVDKYSYNKNIPYGF